MRYRSLLVSHWPVASNASVEITKYVQRDWKKPNFGKSEALCRSRLKLINDSKNPEYAHPYFWAPFVVVGEGGSIQTQN